MPVLKSNSALRSLPKSERTRSAILRTAAAIASVHGLDGLSIGGLAEELGMSKSGLFAHFGSKEELQLAAIETARQIFIDQVFRPALQTKAGLPRLWSIWDSWLSHARGKLFPGGCFFTQAGFEFDSRSGPVRDRIAEIMHEWISTLTRAVQEAQKAGHLAKDVDAQLLAFEMHALAMGALWASQLLDDRQAFNKARNIVREKLDAFRTRNAPALA